jgi:hypothetical protein
MVSVFKVSSSTRGLGGLSLYGRCSKGEGRSFEIITCVWQKVTADDVGHNTEYRKPGRDFQRSGQFGDRQLCFEDADRTGLRQFADHDKIVRLTGHQLVLAREHADGDGQIETQPGNSAPPS